MKKTALIIIAIVCIHTNTNLDKCNIDYLRHDKVKVMVYSVVATMYFPVASQCDDSPLITANGSKINPLRASEQRMIAVSRDLLKHFKYGDRIRISNAGRKNGIYTITDCMNKRFHSRIDFLETVDTPIYKLKNVKIQKVS